MDPDLPNIELCRDAIKVFHLFIWRKEFNKS